MKDTINFYDKNANVFNEQYLSINSEEIHKSWLKHLPNAGQALDIGAGSGRDALWLFHLGFEVIAVEPAEKLRELGQKNTENKTVNWIDDSLPGLNSVERLNKKFDLILLSAVWMHLQPDYRYEAFQTVISLLNTGGKLVITLRHGKSPDKRKMYPIDVNELVSFASQHRLTLCGKYNDKDKLNRNDIYWDTLVFQNL